MSYTTFTLDITFNSTSSSGRKIPSQIDRLVTTFTLDSYTPTVVNLINISCSTDHGCNRDLFVDLSIWLWEQNYTELQRRFSMILIKNKDFPIRCVNESSSPNTLVCKKNRILCALYTSYTIDNEDPGYSGGCAGQSRKYTTVRISTWKNISRMTNEIFLTCMFNECNNRMIFSNILDTVKSLYNGSHLIERNFPLNMSSITSTCPLNSTQMPTTIGTTYARTSPSITTRPFTDASIAHQTRTVTDDTEETRPPMNNTGQTTIQANNAVLLRDPKLLTYLLFYLIFLL